MSYFPLREGYKAEYKYFFKDYSSNSMFDPPYVTDHQWDGGFNLEVVDTYVKNTEQEIFYKIRTTLFLEPDSIASNEYDVMYKNGFLWYVEIYSELRKTRCG